MYFRSAALSHWVIYCFSFCSHSKTPALHTTLDVWIWQKQVNCSRLNRYAYHPPMEYWNIAKILPCLVQAMYDIRHGTILLIHKTHLSQFMYSPTSGVLAWTTSIFKLAHNKEQSIQSHEGLVALKLSKCTLRGIYHAHRYIIGNSNVLYLNNPGLYLLKLLARLIMIQKYA